MTNIQDDLDLLHLFLQGSKSSSPMYQPTNYWAVYEERFVPELEQLGLQNFRARRNSILSSFGATDLWTLYPELDLRHRWYISSRLMARSKTYRKWVKKQNEQYLEKVYTRHPEKIKALHNRTFDFVEQFGKRHGAIPLRELDCSMIGSPEEHFEIEGKQYTTSMLYYYMRYAWCSGHLDFAKEVNTFVELGSGSGKQIEVMKKFYPEMTFMIFDIPPQIYVAEQYLKAVFPGDVVSYRDTRHMTQLPEDRKGKIFIFGNWQFPILQNTDVDLFWNCASFQEMEPEVVRNYLSVVSQAAKNVYLFAVMKPIIKQAPERGEEGVIKVTTQQDYLEPLGGFDLVAQERGQEPGAKQLWEYEDYLFRAKAT